MKKRSKQVLPTQLALLCYSCEQPRSFIVSAIQALPPETPPEEYTFAYCATCMQPSVFYREDVGDGFENDDYYRVYPVQDRHIGYYLPKIVRKSYEEAVLCELAKSWMACAVMVGRTLEAVCKEFDPSARNIFKGLKSMYEKGMISRELHDWATELRVLRNVGAHASSASISRTDAKSALDFLQAILEIFYDLRPKFEEFKRRRELDLEADAADSDSESDAND